MRRQLSFAATLIAIAAMLFAVPAAAAIGDWANGSKARMRLIAAGVGDDGRLSAAIEITLPPGWTTYWRFPGDAGIAPTFDFSASRNVGKPEVSFPVPKRYSDGFTVTNIYAGRVVLPLSLPVSDPNSAVDLVVSVELGVCDIICIPDHAVARLLVPAGKADPAAAKIVADARSLLPGPAQPGVFAADAAKRTGGTDKRPVFEVAITAPDAAKATVFVEGPPDWYPDTPALVSSAGNQATFRVNMDRLIARTPIEGATFRVTIASGGKAIEQVVPVQ